MYVLSNTMIRTDTENWIYVHFIDRHENNIQQDLHQLFNSCPLCYSIKDRYLKYNVEEV